MEMIKGWSLFLTVFLLLSLTIPLFTITFENFQFYMYIPSSDRTPPQPIEIIRGTNYEDFLLFNVSPTFPLLFWRIETYDYYDGYSWKTTTESKPTESRNQHNTSNIFTVELSSSANENYLPIPSPTSIVFNFTTSPNMKFKVLYDETAGIYKAQLLETASQVEIVYKVTWDSPDFTDISKGNTTLENMPENIRETYLQLPENVPTQVKELAENLKNSSIDIFDQVAKDVKYIVSNFEYDYDLLTGKIQRIIDQDWVLWFLKRGKGVCLDAATALAIILRIQGIPARVCGGFKPSYIVGDKVLYYTGGAHALTEVYLPLYGWIPFDATPPGELDSLPEDQPPWKPSDNRGPPVYLLRTLTSNTLIRNETNEIKGMITTNAEETINSSVKISLDNYEIANAKTKADGSFSYQYYVNPGEEAGKHVLAFDVDSKNLTVKQEVKIVTRTFLTATAVKKALFGNSFLISLHLLDDTGQPLEGQPITLENYGLSGETDREGKLEFSIDPASTVLPENILLVASFDGSDQFLDAKTSTELFAESSPLIFAFILFGLLYVTFGENLPNRLFIRSFREANNAKRLASALPLFVNGEKSKKVNSRLRIHFPEIENSLPPVWGVKDELSIECALEHDAKSIFHNKLSVLVNGVKVFEREANGDKHIASSHVFEKKGPHQITAILYDEASTPLDMAEAELHIVDYREEIIRLYQTFLQSLIQRGVNVKNSMTAREIERMLEQAGMASLDAACVTECFEESEYSHHSIVRKNYRATYLALKEMSANVE
jgi:transglutaminase-like putative cysteine protease